MVLLVTKTQEPTRLLEKHRAGSPRPTCPELKAGPGGAWEASLFSSQCAEVYLMLRAKSVGEGASLFAEWGGEWSINKENSEKLLTLLAALLW